MSNKKKEILDVVAKITNIIVGVFIMFGVFFSLLTNSNNYVII